VGLVVAGSGGGTAVCGGVVWRGEGWVGDGLFVVAVAAGSELAVFGFTDVDAPGATDVGVDFSMNGTRAPRTLPGKSSGVGNSPE
jgi:hypothetical protein